MAERYYVNQRLEPGLVVLQGAEAHHLAAVCRLGVGDQVCLFNGDGREYQAELTGIRRRDVELHIRGSQEINRELSFELVVAAPLPKGDRGQFLIEKLTELGVTRFVPLETQRAVRIARSTRLDKLQRYVIEAAKQCGRNRLMQIEPTQPWEAFSQRDDLPARKLLAQPGGAPLEARAAGTATAIAAGPEGGFTEQELATARAARWQLIDLGPRILRIETAAITLAGWFAISARPAAPVTGA